MDCLVDEIWPHVSPSKKSEVMKLKNLKADLAQLAFIKSELLKVVDEDTFKAGVRRALQKSRMRRQHEADLMRRTVILELSSVEEVGVLFS